MSYNNNLQDNNAELQAILNAVNELPTGGSTSGVTSWNDLEDKPFGEIASDTLVWDGTYNADEVVFDLLAHISDAVPTVSDLANGITAKFTVIEGETVVEDEMILSGEDIIGMIQKDGFLMADIFAIVPYDNYVLASDGLGDIVFPKAGTYILLVATSLTVTIPGYTGFGTVKKLDPKYLPDWNDWKDKPFGEFKGDTLTWDGAYNPDELVAELFVRISDAVPTVSDLANGLIVSSALLSESVVISGEDAMAGFREDGYGALGEIASIVPYDGYDRGDVVFPKAGVYTLIELPDLTITIPNYKGFITVKKIDKKYLPEASAGTGADAIPSYWQAHIEEKVATIKALQDEGGKDCFSFIVMADTHYPSNLGKKSPILAKHILDKCDIRYALLLGDAQTRGCYDTKELILAENKQIEEMLSPIRDRLLQTEGNHDGAYGWLDRDGDGKYDNTDKAPAERESYVYNFTPAELHSAIYRKVGLVGDVHFDESGSGYYIDDIANKVRYIILNTQCNKYELQADGTSKYPKMWLMNFTQPQHDLVIEALNSVPSDSWGVIVAGHCPLFQEIGDRVVMQGVLNAYVNKTTYVGEYAGVAEGGPLYTNQIPISIDAEGNKVGLLENYRYNSSDVLVVAEGVNATGFIPAKADDVIRFKNIQFRNETINGVSAGSYYIRGYDKDFNSIGSLNLNGTMVPDYMHYIASEWSFDEEGNMASFKIKSNFTALKYIRLAFVPVEGVEAIITVNEEIAANYTNLAEPLPDNTTDTTKWVNGYRLSSTGLAARSDSTVSNSIPCAYGDVIRIKGVTLRENDDRFCVTFLDANGDEFDDLQYWHVENSFKCELIDDTYVITIKHSRAIRFRFAMPTPEDANAIILTKNQEIVGSESTGAPTGKGYDYVSVNCDFSNAKGQLVGYFHGHTHVDSDNTTNGVKNIGTRCDAREENTEELRNERVEGTITEQSFNVFTVNKKTRKIYATKIGAGNNREINY